LSPREVCSRDKFRIIPRSNTITVSTPDEDRQLAYLQIRSLVIGGKTHEVAAHMATPSDSTRIVVPKALFFDGTEDAEDILLSCIAQNPQCQVLAARRMGKSRALLVTIRGKRTPTYFYFNGFTLFCFPYRDRIEACVNCRRTGHRADVCPCHPRRGATAADPNTRRKTKMAALRVPAPVRHLRGQAHHGLQRMLTSLFSPP
ncbi:unnamed protein product, partial [Ixodes hexagonus]